MPLPLPLALQLQTAWQGGVNGLAGDLLFASYGSVSGSGRGEHLCASCDVSGVRISHMHRLSVGSSNCGGSRQQAAASQEGHSARTLTSQAVRRLRCCSAANDAALCMVISATLDYSERGEGEGGKGMADTALYSALRMTNVFYARHFRQSRPFKDLRTNVPLRNMPHHLVKFNL